MAQASRTNGKGRSRPRTTNGAHEQTDSGTPARDYSIAAVGRALDLLEALSRIGPAPLATLASAARCTRTAGFPPAADTRGARLRHPGRGAWDVAARRALGRLGAGGR